MFLPAGKRGSPPAYDGRKWHIGLEEERRLAYVGITRARRNLFISFASSRRIHGQWQSSIPSRFVQELPADNIVEDMVQGTGFDRVMISRLDSFSGNRYDESYIAGEYGPGWRRMAKRGALDTKDGKGSEVRWEAASSKTEFTIGDRVFHQKFGMGNILSIDGDKLLIAFDKAGNKKVISGFVSRP